MGFLLLESLSFQTVSVHEPLHPQLEIFYHLGGATMIYLDHAATTPLRPDVAEAMARIHREAFGNPSSQHAVGRKAKGVLEEARERIVALLGGTATGPRRDRLVFTSGATEGNRLAIVGVAGAAVKAGLAPGSVNVSARDHRSVLEAAGALAKIGFQVRQLPLSPEGVPEWSRWLESAPQERSCNLFSTTTVCGQTGIVDDPSVVPGALPGTLLAADATQAVAFFHTAFGESSAATLVLAPHKFGGPRGIGAVLVRHGVPIEPVAAGTQESGIRGGTEPVALAAGFAAALESAVRERSEQALRLRKLRDAFERELTAAARSLEIEALVIGENRPRAPHISTIAFPGLDRQAIVMAADLAGIACSTGSACSSGSSEPAPALLAMGLEAAVVRSTVRFSFGSLNASDELGAVIAQLTGILGAARRVSAHAPADQPSRRN